MPELPDVEVFRQYVDATALHQRVESAEIRDADDLLEGVTAKRLESTLRGHQLASTRRHGKYLFVELQPHDGWLVLHFGMTGFPRYFRSPDDVPQHTRLLCRFENGFHLAYDCQRKLGRISLVKEPDDLVGELGLGPDAFDDRLDVDRFRELLAGRRGAIKPALMNQQILAGIGNVYSDELLFQARVHPATPVDELDTDTLREIHRTMRHVLRIAIERRARVEDFPSTWLLPHEDDSCPRCGTEIQKQTVSGRTARFCPDCQRRRRPS